MVENTDGFIDQELGKPAPSYAMLSFNDISDERAIYLGGALKTNTSVTHLYISKNTFGSAGTSAIAGALKVNNTLVSIDFSTNNPQEDGFKALGEALAVNSSLEDLNLDETVTLPEGVNPNDFNNPLVHVLEGLKSNQKIKNLSLNANSLTDKIIPVLNSLFESNKVIYNINLRWNSFSEEGIQTLNKIQRNLILD